MFPGDPEFTSENYPFLCYGYVVRAISVGSKNLQLSLHENERPIALLSSLIANQNRNSKKKAEPYKLDEFCLYKPREQQDLPAHVYGSAAVTAIKRRLLPSWALFCYRSLAGAANPDYEPKNCIFIAEDAILLHPTFRNGEWHGMLIAREKAGGKKCAFRTELGETIMLTVPPIDTKVVAMEDVTLS